MPVDISPRPVGCGIGRGCQVELGTMLTVGASRRFILGSTIVENAMLSLLGGCITLAIGQWTARLTLKAFSTGIFTLLFHIPPLHYLGFYLLAVALTVAGVLLLAPRVGGLDLPALAREASR